MESHANSSVGSHLHLSLLLGLVTAWPPRLSIFLLSEPHHPRVFLEQSDIASGLFLAGWPCLWWQLSSGERLATWLFWLETIPNLVPLALHVISDEGEGSVTIIKRAENTGGLVPEKRL